MLNLSEEKKPQRPVFKKVPKCHALSAYGAYRCAEVRIGAYCVVEMRASALDSFGAWSIGLGI